MISITPAVMNTTRTNEESVKIFRTNKQIYLDSLAIGDKVNFAMNQPCEVKAIFDGTLGDKYVFKLEGISSYIDNIFTPFDIKVSASIAQLGYRKSDFLLSVRAPNFSLSYQNPFQLKREQTKNG
jgi:hypothetical protein